MDAGAHPFYSSSDHFSALPLRESSFNAHPEDISHVQPGMDSNRALNALSKDNLKYRLYPARLYDLAGIVQSCALFYHLSPSLILCCRPYAIRLSSILLWPWLVSGLGLSLTKVRYFLYISGFIISRALPHAVALVVKDFDITLNQVNWLINIVSLVFLPVSLAVPRFCQRFWHASMREQNHAAI
jgi:hypothetical protein